jgi:hypothetical protein
VSEDALLDRALAAAEQGQLSVLEELTSAWTGQGFWSKPRRFLHEREKIGRAIAAGNRIEDFNPNSSPECDRAAGARPPAK